MKRMVSLRFNEIEVKLRRALMMLLLTSAVFVADSFCQYRPNVVFWSEKPDCGSKKSVNNSTHFVCDRLIVNEQIVRVAESGAVKLSVLPVRSLSRITLYVKVENKGKEKFEFAPSEWSIAHYASEDDFKEGKPTLLNETSLKPPRPGPSAAIVRSGSDPFAMPNTRTVTTISDGRGDVTMPTTVLPGNQRQTVVVPQTRSTSPSLERTVSRKSSLRAGIFKTVPFSYKSVWVEDQTSGTVLFNRLNESAFQLAVIHIGDTTFVFSLR